MKKLTISILCLLTAAFAVFGLTACQKQTGDTNCSHALTVLKSGAEKHWYECDCGLKTGNAENHVWDDGTITVEPTEDSEGAKLCTCTVCGVSATLTVPPLSHEHVLTEVAEIPATCEEDGRLGYWHCDGCSGNFVDASAETQIVDITSLVIPAINHANEAYSHTVAPRCGVEGAEVFVCPDCDRVREEVIEALEHSWNAVETVEATCQHGGYTLNECGNCHTQEKVNVTGISACHEEYEITVEATCDAEGVGVYTCRDCLKSREVVIEKHDHDYGEEVIAPTCEEGGYTLHVCSVCNSSYKDNLTESLGGHEWVISTEKSIAPDCITAGKRVEVCSHEGCNAERAEELEALGHEMIPATCTTVEHCANCDLVGATVLPHAYVEQNRVGATCTEDGHVDYKCADCDAVKTETPVELKAKGHNENAITNWETVELPVAGEQCKYYTQRTGVCPDCNETVVKIGEGYFSHSYTSEITTPATCSQEGVKTYTCSCGDSYTKKYSEEGAHKLVVSSTEGNITVYTCEYNCGHTERTLANVGSSASDINASDVKDAENITLGETTLTMDDATKGQLGEDSKVNLSAGELTKEEYDEAVSKLNDDQKALLGANSKIYNFEMEVDGNPVTNFDGQITIKIPYELGENEDPEDLAVWYIDDKGVPQLVLAKYIVVDGKGYAEFATSHFSYYTVAKMTPKERCKEFGHYTEGSVTVYPATCLEGGYTLTVCRRCGEKFYSNPVEALGHDWREVEELHVDANCTVDGYEKHECYRCGVAYEVKTSALGHNWVENLERGVDASCTAQGVRVFECSDCDEEYSITIKMLAHSYEYTVIASTCSSAGYTEGVCRDCNDTIIKNPTPMLSHTIVDTVHAPTCLSKGYTSHECVKCHTKFADTDFVDKVDHEWDREEPTCEEDKLCKHCKTRAENGKAHGHFMQDGSCKHCAKPCNHTYQFSHTVESSCMGGGYEVWICKHCNHNDFRGQTGATSHDFVIFKEVEATCQTPAYKVEICRVCGYSETTEIGGTVNHKYVDGKCVYCGLVHEVVADYIDIINTIRNTNGVSLKVENLKVEAVEIDSEGNSEIIGEVTQIQIIELMLYLDENGKWQGAGTGAMTILNGPVDGIAVISFKAVIKGEYLYCLASMETTSEEVYKVRYSVDALVDTILDEMGFGGENSDNIAQSGILDLLTSLIDTNSATINGAISKFINLLFTPEKTDDGFVYTLDFAKLHGLNSDLANLAISEFVDKYFGEGSFEAVEDFALELLGTELKDLPAFVESLGLPAEDIIDVINQICALSGAPEGFDIRDALNSPEMEGAVVGMMIMQGEYDPTMIEDLFRQLSVRPVYVLLADEMGASVEELYDMVGMMISSVEELIDVTFTVDKQGYATEFNVSIDNMPVMMGGGGSNSPDYGYEEESKPTEKPNKGDGEYSEPYSARASYQSVTTISFDLTITLNGKINVTWGDIADGIDGEIVLPELDDQISISETRQNMTSGGMEVDGIFYEYQAMVFSQEEVANYYSNIMGVSVFADCGDWVEYQLMYPRERSEYMVALYMLLENGEYTKPYAEKEEVKDEVVDKEEDTSGEQPSAPMNFRYVLANGYLYDSNTLSVDVTVAEDGSTISVVNVNGETVTLTMEEFMNVKGTLVKVFGEAVPQYRDSYSSGEIVYYNTVTGEYAGESQHNYVLDEENSYEPTGCEERGLNLYVCTVCGSSHENYYSYGHDYTRKYCLNENSETCEDGLDVYHECERCGDILDYEYNAEFGHQMSENAVYDGTHFYYERSCMACGLKEGSDAKFELVTDYELSITNDIRYYGGFTFEFLPTANETVEIYTNSTEYFHCELLLLNADGKVISRNENRYDEMTGKEFYALAFDCVAGEKYYIVVEPYGYSSSAKNQVYVVARPADEEVDLAPYGATCGGKMIIHTEFGVKRVEFNLNCALEYGDEYSGRCANCGFSWEYVRKNQSDENCQEIIEIGYIFVDADGESQEYILSTVETGYYKHETNYDSDYTEEEGVDENGNPITICTETGVETCIKCGKEVRKTEYVRHIDSNGREIFSSENHYRWSDYAGACVIRESNEYGYVYVTDANGNSVRRPSLEAHYRYDNEGNLSSWDRSEYVYETSCRVLVTRTSSRGENWQESIFNHMHAQKELPDESGSGEGMYEGIDCTFTISAIETYCPLCHASISKVVSTVYYDRNGNEIATIHEYYDPYALSEEEYGWELRERETYKNGVVEYSEGAFAAYTVYHEDIYFVKGSFGNQVEHGYKYIYNYYDPENSCYCEYVRYEIYAKGEEYFEREVERYEEERHIYTNWIHVLQDGSTSCLDGVYYADVCYVCNWKNIHYQAGAYHSTERYYAHVDNVQVYNLAEYGQVCENGTVTVVTCPCGTVSEVYLDYETSGCDFGCISDVYVEEEGTYEHWLATYFCAVTNKDCSFGYTHEYWREYDENCIETYRDIWTFGVMTAEGVFVSDNNLVISTVDPTGNVNHSWNNATLVEEYVEEEGEYTVYVNVSDYFCYRCGHACRREIHKEYYVTANSEISEDGYISGEIVKVTNENINYASLGERIISSTEYCVSEIIYHPTEEDRSEWVNTYEKYEQYENGEVYYWYEYEYSYDVCIYAPYSIYRNSYGEYREEQREHEYWCSLTYEQITESTCTQEGLARRTCTWCHTYTREEINNPHGHSYYYNEELQLYVCSYCGLQNFNGVDGNYWLEDMTDISSGYFTVGYYVTDKELEHQLVVSLVVEGQDDFVYLWDVIAYDDGRSIITVSISDVQAACESAGYTFSEVGVRITINPINMEDTFDYSIVIDSHQNA